MFWIAPPCSFTEFLILIGYSSSFFEYFDWSVLLSIFFNSKILSQPFFNDVFGPCFQWWRIGFVWLQQSGSHFLGTCLDFYKYRLQVKFVLCLEINFISCIIIAIVYKHFWCQIHRTVVFAQLVCSSNYSSGISGLRRQDQQKAAKCFFKLLVKIVRKRICLYLDPKMWTCTIFSCIWIILYPNYFRTLPVNFSYCN